MKLRDLEHLAITWLHRADMSADAPPHPAHLAEALFGRECLRLAVDYPEPAGLGKWAMCSGAVHIHVRPGLDVMARRWVVFHEIAEVILWREGVRCREIEAHADSLGAMLRAPSPAFLRAIELHGDKWEQLGLDFVTSQTSAALRYGETTHEPMALVTATSVRLRGRQHAWPSDMRAASLAPSDGLRIESLPDAPNRVLLRVA